MRGTFVIGALALAACIVPVQQQQPAGGGGGYSGGGGGGGGDPYANNAPPPGGGGGGGGAPAAGPVSVTIRSSCPQTVRVFYGDKPKYGSGTTSSISSNSVNSHTFQPGDMFWIVDESDNGVDSVTVGPGINTIEIGSSCTSMSTR
jgi:hypothetical protein